MLATLITTVFNNLNTSNVKYIVLRNYDKYPYEVGNDIDILVNCRDESAAIKATKEAYKSVGASIKELPIQSNGFLLKAERSDGLSLAIHFQYWISFEFSWLHSKLPGCSYKIFLDAIEPINYSKNGCAFFIASDTDRFIMLLKQWVFKKKLAYKSELIALLQAPDIQFLFYKAKLQHKMTESSLFESDKVTIDIMKHLINAHWYKQSQSTNYIKALVMVLNNKKKKFISPLIYITGPDGAGKTSVSSILSTAFSEKNFNYKHVYSIKRNIFRHVIFAIRRVISGKNDNKFSENPSARKFRFIMTEDITDRDDNSYLWKLRKLTTLCISILDVFINFIPVMYFRLKYDVVIVETSPYDIFIKYHMPQFNWLEKLFAPLLPKSTLGLLLKADSEKIAARKHELTPSEIDLYYERLDTLLERAHCKNDFHTIRTDIDINETKQKLYNIINNELN